MLMLGYDAGITKNAINVVSIHERRQMIVKKLRHAFLVRKRDATHRCRSSCRACQDNFLQFRYRDVKRLDRQAPGYQVGQTTEPEPLETYTSSSFTRDRKSV